jgi:hypothetical protein
MNRSLKKATAVATLLAMGACTDAGLSLLSPGSPAERQVPLHVYEITPEQAAAAFGDSPPPRSIPFAAGSGRATSRTHDFTDSSGRTHSLEVRTAGSRPLSAVHSVDGEIVARIDLTWQRTGRSRGSDGEWTAERIKVTTFEAGARKFGTGGRPGSGELSRQEVEEFYAELLAFYGDCTGEWIAFAIASVSMFGCAGVFYCALAVAGYIVSLHSLDSCLGAASEDK